MFNSFLNDRKQAQVQEIERLKQRFIKDELLRKSYFRFFPFNPTLFRITRKIVQKLQEKGRKLCHSSISTFFSHITPQMAEKPILTHDFVPPVVKIRDEDPSKFLGAPSIAVRSFKNEKDRIKVLVHSIFVINS